MPSTENGRKRVREADSIVDNSGSQLLRLIGNEESFVYHMTNQCYRKYALHKSLDRIRAGFIGGHRGQLPRAPLFEGAPQLK